MLNKMCNQNHCLKLDVHWFVGIVSMQLNKAKFYSRMFGFKENLHRSCYKTGLNSWSSCIELDLKKDVFLHDDLFSF